MDNVAAIPRSRKDIRKFTIILRELFGLQNEVYFKVVSFIELGLAELGLNFEIVDKNEMEMAYGIMNTGTDTMYIRSDVYEGAIMGNPRDRFTLCHELGHFLLHQPNYVAFARGQIPAYQNPEWQANTFAAELLAPAELIKNFTIEEIQNNCGMSKEAATIQYKTLHNM